MEREDFYKEIGRHRKLVLPLALNCYQHCLEHRSFENASYFEAYVERLSARASSSTNAMSSSLFKGFALYQKGANRRRAAANAGSWAHIFDVLTSEQVAYYQEQSDKFVKNECS